MWDLVSSLRLQGLALGPGENPARTRGRADKQWWYTYGCSRSL